MGILQRLFDDDLPSDLDRLLHLEQRQRQSEVSNLRTSSELRARVVELENDVGELALLCRSLLTYLREVPGWNNERFYEILRRIDAADGVIDGKITKLPVKPRPTGMPRRRDRD